MWVGWDIAPVPNPSRWCIVFNEFLCPVLSIHAPLWSRDRLYTVKNFEQMFWILQSFVFVFISTGHVFQARSLITIIGFYIHLRRTIMYIINETHIKLFIFKNIFLKIEKVVITFSIIEKFFSKNRN